MLILKYFYANLLLFFFQYHTLECHADACALFIGGNNLANVNSKVLEEWIKQNKSIKKNFVHVIKKKKEEYV